MAEKRGDLGSKDSYSIENDRNNMHCTCYGTYYMKTVSTVRAAHKYFLFPSTLHIYMKNMKKWGQMAAVDCRRAL